MEQLDNQNRLYEEELKEKMISLGEKPFKGNSCISGFIRKRQEAMRK